MKKLLILGLALSALTLTACGQNVGGIQQEFAENSGSKEVPSFTGYTLVLSEKNMEKVKAFVDENKVRTGLNINDDLKLEPLDKVPFRNSEYKKIVEIREKYESELSALKQKVKQSIEEDAANINGKIAELEAEQKKLELSLKDYTDAIAPQQAELDKANASVEAIDQQMKAILEKFYQEFSKIVVENELPIDKNARPDPNRFYRSYTLRQGVSCDNTVETTHSDGRKVIYCVEPRIDASQAALAPALVSYGMAQQKLIVEKDVARSNVRTAQKALSDAKIIAKNKFNIDVNKIEGLNNRVTRQIKTLRSDLEYSSDFKRRLEREINQDDALSKTRREHSAAVREYRKSVEIEALSESGYDFSNFSDEEDTPKLSEKERGIAIYVFTNEKDRQAVFMAPIDGGNDKNYLQLFKRDSRSFDVDFKVEKEKDVIKLVSEVI
jgi:uncharacterized coiled-coil protein SlyX